MLKLIICVALAACVAGCKASDQTPRLMSDAAPRGTKTTFRFGAGDGLGQGVFENYKAVVRARERDMGPAYVRTVGHDETPTFERWSIGLLMGDVVIRLDAVEGRARLVFEQAPGAVADIDPRL